MAVALDKLREKMDGLDYCYRTVKGVLNDACAESYTESSEDKNLVDYFISRVGEINRLIEQKLKKDPSTAYLRLDAPLSLSLSGNKDLIKAAQKIFELNISQLNYFLDQSEPEDKRKGVQDPLFTKNYLNAENEKKYAKNPLIIELQHLLKLYSIATPELEELLKKPGNEVLELSDVPFVNLALETVVKINSLGRDPALQIKLSAWNMNFKLQKRELINGVLKIFNSHIGEIQDFFKKLNGEKLDKTIEKPEQTIEKPLQKKRSWAAFGYTALGVVLALLFYSYFYPFAFLKAFGIGL